MASTHGEVDPVLRTAVKVLNSSQSAEKIRLMIDDIIKVKSRTHTLSLWTTPCRVPSHFTPSPSLLQTRYGPSKMLINTLSKKFLAEEQPAPALITTSSSSDDSNSMEVAYDHSNVILGDSKDQQQQEIEDSSLKELEELFCATCGDVTTSIRNQLFECCECHLLYHQDCHKPPINDADVIQSEWQCSKCRSSIQPVESVLTSSSSTSSSPTVFAAKTSSSSSPHSSHSSSSKSGSHRKSGGGGGGSKSGGSGSGGGGGGSSSGILSADKRLANMKKKAAKMQKTK